MSIDEKLENKLEKLEQYAKQCALPTEQHEESSNEATRLLTITPSQLKKFNENECGEAAIMLCQFALFLQQKVNRENVIIKWCEEALKKILAKKVSNYKGNSYEERRLAAIHDNDAAARIDTIRVEAELRLSRIAYLSINTTTIAKQISLLQQSRRKADV